MQTGRWPTSTGVFRNGLPLPEDVPTLASVLGAAGYATGYIGKWHLAGEENPDGPVPPGRRGGYAHWLASDRLEFTSDAYRTVVHDEEGEPVRLPGYRSDALVDAAIRFVADHHDRPFLLFLSLLEPHHQNPTDDYPAPPGTGKRYEGRWLPPDLAALSPGAPHGGAHRHLGGYLGQVKRVDEGVGRLRDALRSLGIEDDTVLAWTADHGSHFRTRNSEYKRSAHDSSVRVPWALTGPGFRGGGLVRRPVSTADLMPTLVEAVGLDVPEGCRAGRCCRWWAAGRIRAAPSRSSSRSARTRSAGRCGPSGGSTWCRRRPGPTPGASRRPAATGRPSCTTWPPTRTNWRTWWDSSRTGRWPTDCGRRWPGGCCGWRADPVIEPAAPRSLDQRRPDSFPYDRVPWEG